MFKRADVWKQTPSAENVTLCFENIKTQRLFTFLCLFMSWCSSCRAVSLSTSTGIRVTLCVPFIPLQRRLCGNPSLLTVCPPGFVQFLQYYYQSGCLYRLRTLGERNQLDLTVGTLYAIFGRSHFDRLNSRAICNTMSGEKWGKGRRRRRLLTSVCCRADVWMPPEYRF